MYTRRDGPDVPENVETPQGYKVIHVPAGPPERLAGDDLLRTMGSFAQYLAAAWTSGLPSSP